MTDGILLVSCRCTACQKARREIFWCAVWFAIAGGLWCGVRLLERGL